MIIRQGKEQNFQPQLYIEPAADYDSLSKSLKDACLLLQQEHEGLEFEPLKDSWLVRIGEEFRIGHETHFSQVTENFLKYLAYGALPDWEVPNMLAKYYTTTEALKLALRS